MEKTVKIILLIVLFCAGLCVLINEKRLIDHRTELENCPYRTSFVAYTKDLCEVKVRSQISYDANLVALDDVSTASVLAKDYAQSVIGRYSNYELTTNCHITDIDDEVTDSLHLYYNSNLTWRITTLCLTKR